MRENQNDLRHLNAVHSSSSSVFSFIIRRLLAQGAIIPEERCRSGECLFSQFDQSQSSQQRSSSDRRWMTCWSETCPVFPQTSARTNGSCPTALLKVLSGRGKDDSRVSNCDSFLQHTVHRGTCRRPFSFRDVDIVRAIGFFIGHCFQGYPLWIQSSVLDV